MSEGGGSSRTAAAASQTGPDDLAAELNPHETELNPHKAVPVGQPRRSRSKAAPFRARRIAHQHAADKGRAGGHVACDPRHP